MSTKPINDKVIDIDLSAIRRQRIRIDGDDNRIVELNLSDMGIMQRLRSAYNELTQLSTKYHITEENENTDNTDEIIETLQNIDNEMRRLIDYVFDSEMSEIVAPFGTMADPINGKFRYEYIIEKFIGLYDSNFETEFKKMSKNVQKHTDKYTGK